MSRRDQSSGKLLIRLGFTEVFHLLDHPLITLELGYGYRLVIGQILALESLKHGPSCRCVDYNLLADSRRCGQQGADEDNPRSYGKMMP